MISSEQYKAVVLISLACLAAAVVIIIHQIVVWGVIFEIDDFLHHENFALIFAAIGLTALSVTMLAVPKCTSKNQRNGRFCR